MIQQYLIKLQAGTWGAAVLSLGWDTSERPTACNNRRPRCAAPPGGYKAGSIPFNERATHRSWDAFLGCQAVTRDLHPSLLVWPNPQVICYLMTE